MYLAAQERHKRASSVVYLQEIQKKRNEAPNVRAKAREMQLRCALGLPHTQSTTATWTMVAVQQHVPLTCVTKLVRQQVKDA